ncbi:MAG TPA: hypothetical protein VK509_23115 [Polyangiales bacterium]|nr:hypothetical protein [Polyangiales bacterium]
MHAARLIDALVRQTTVLIATLATASGQRAQLAHVASLVFADLVRELREQGIGNKVIADMFGMALRTYRRKVARLSASQTVQGQSLWEAVLTHVQQRGPLARADVLRRFARDDETVLRSVLLDLIESGLLQEQGEGDAAQLAAAPESPVGGPAQQAATLESLVLVALHRGGPLELAELANIIPAGASELEGALAQLVESGLCTLEQRGPHKRWSCERCVIGFGDELGWEAAVLDHYQAMVGALVHKLRSGTRRSALGDQVGGSTFVFDLWEGHPLQERALGYLRSMREQGSALRQAIDEHTASTPPPPDVKTLRVVAYVGQNVTSTEDSDE